MCVASYTTHSVFFRSYPLRLVFDIIYDNSAYVVCYVLLLVLLVDMMNKLLALTAVDSNINTINNIMIALILCF